MKLASQIVFPDFPAFQWVLEKLEIIFGKRELSSKNGVCGSLAHNEREIPRHFYDIFSHFLGCVKLNFPIFRENKGARRK